MPFLPWLLELAVLLILLIIGVLIIVFIAKVVFFFLPAAIVALVVWFITGGDRLLTGIAFLVVATVSIARRK